MEAKELNERVVRLVDLLADRDLDALLVSAPENRRYLSGFTGSAGYLLISRDQAALATDSRYTEQASGQAPHFQVVQAGGGWGWLTELLSRTGVKRLGFESRVMTVDTYHNLLQALQEDPGLDRASLVAVTDLVEELRVVKDHEELALLQRAIDASDGAMEAVCPTLREGMTEREVAWRLEVAMREHGADGVSFGTIVAAGPNGAMPHHQPTDYAIRRGEPIVIDMGARVGGYCSDISRTVTVGDPDELFPKIYDIVLGAQLTAINTAQAGMTGKDCDNLARSVIAAAGYGDNFGHSLGHGVGLKVHESPGVGPRSANTLSAGMVFTVEPGIYVTGWGGVRIEDIVVLGEAGASPLSKAAK